MRHRQHGMTFIGLLMILALVGILAYAGIQLVPVYLNYMKLTRTLEQVAVEFKGDTPDPGRIRTALDRHWTIEDITGITPKEVEITREGDGVVMHANYSQAVPFLGNITLTATFDKTVPIE
ncbi:MAG: DUF4845 domain-containing protein [Proteobacteria bacterium]|nr:DUF4845 domain-containing protein [Pseudomonadota bacterium]